MKIAVIGAGIFGITTAIRLSQNHDVDLFEQKDDILPGASSINQFRLHRGYHYPRSDETADAAIASEPLFRLEYFEALINDAENYYCIAKEGSKTTAEDFIKFCERHKLFYQIEDCPVVNKEKVSVTIRAKESLIDPIKLKEVCWRKIKESRVNLKLKSKATKEILDHYDKVIIATYATLNELLEDYPEKHLDYQYELCEKIVVELPNEFDNKAIVILDGEFMCIDPFGSTGMFLMGNVVHAIHQANIGKFPIFDSKFNGLLNNGIIKNPPVTNFKKFIETTAEYFPLVKHAKHFGSMYTFRTVLPYKDKTDERPTLVRQINDKIITIFSGKIVTCVEAAEEVNLLIENPTSKSIIMPEVTALN